jgi:hypothetical protein
VQNTLAPLAIKLSSDGHQLVQPLSDATVPQANKAVSFSDAICTPSPAKKQATPATMAIKKRAATTYDSPAAGMMSPQAEQQHMSMQELNESAARLGLTDDIMKVGQLSVPVLRGSWQKKIRKEDDDGDFVTTFKEFNLIRILPHSSIALKQCVSIWLNPQQLKVGIVWPKWFKSAKRQIAFQTTGSTHKFDADHDVIDSLQDDINSKKESKKDGKIQRIVDYGIFDFDLPQDMSKGAAEITILNVTLAATDLEIDEEMPPGDQVKVLQIITQQKMNGEDDNLLDVTQRNVSLGN